MSLCWTESDIKNAIAWENKGVVYAVKPPYLEDDLKEFQPEEAPRGLRFIKNPIDVREIADE
ncbi:hypothetical protein ES703_82652 [subsurface metagenome]